MDLSTEYLGMKLSNPFVPSPSILSRDIDKIKQMEDAGAGAVVLYSLFEEQIRHESYEIYHHLTSDTNSFAEGQTFFPEPPALTLEPEEYLNQIRRAKEAVNIPIIGSINGCTLGGWTEYAKKIEQAGADALELNVYFIPTNPDKTGVEIAREYIDILKSVIKEVEIPVAVKLSPFFTNLAYAVNKMEEEGARGFVLFNRFFQPEIDIEKLEIYNHAFLSSSHEYLLPMRWIAILYGQVKADLAATSGIYEAKEAIKMLMAGAKVTMVCSALLKHGIDHLKKLTQDLKDWMEKFEYDSVKQMQGSMSQKNCPDPRAFERAHYVHTITTFPDDINFT